MKRSLVFVPAVLIVLFLVTAFFAPTEKATVTKGKSVSEKKYGRNVMEANVVYKSTDGGKTWQNISAGLPLHRKNEPVPAEKFFATNEGLFLSAGDGIYHTEPGARKAFWKKEKSLFKAGNIAPGKNGTFAYTYGGGIIQKKKETGEWSPVHTNFKSYTHTLFESAGGAIFVASHEGLFKSVNSGKTWNKVYEGRCIMKLADSNGVLLASGNEGILRSSDGGENWDRVITESGMGVTVEPIPGGFAAIAYDTITKTRKIHLSTDGGKTFHVLPSFQAPQSKLFPERFDPSMFISSIKQSGKYLISAHPDGVFRSADMGKTWELMLPAVDKNKVFILSSSGEVVYAIQTKFGC